MTVPSLPLTKEQIEKMKQRLEAGSQEPWIVSLDYDVGGGPTGFARVFEGEFEIVEYKNVEDCEFIAHAREDLRALLSAYQAQQQKIAWWELKWKVETDQLKALIEDTGACTERAETEMLALRAQVAALTAPSCAMAEGLAEELIAIYGAELSRLRSKAAAQGAHPGEQCSRMFTDAISRYMAALTATGEPKS